MTLYKILGLPKGCGRADIRRAYLRLSKKFHPDVGGDAEKFAAIKHAYDVLSDSARRARYDASGDETEIRAPTVDPIQAKALDLIMNMVGKIIFEAGDDIASQPWIKRMNEAIETAKADIVKQIKQLGPMKARGEKLLPRFTRKAAAGDGDNVLSAMVRRHIEAIDQANQKYNEALEVHTRAAAIVADYKFDVEQMLAAQQQAYASNAYSQVGFAGLFGVRR